MIDTHKDIMKMCDIINDFCLEKAEDLSASFSLCNSNILPQPKQAHCK